MPRTLTELTREAAELPPIERLKLARILLDLSETQTESSEKLEAAWEEEIQRRLEELRSGALKGVPLEEVKQRIERRWRS